MSFTINSFIVTSYTFTPYTVTSFTVTSFTVTSFTVTSFTVTFTHCLLDENFDQGKPSRWREGGNGWSLEFIHCLNGHLGKVQTSC